MRRKPSADNTRNIARWRHIDLGSDGVAVYSSTSPTLTVAAVSSSVDPHGRMQQRSGADVGKTRTAAVRTGHRIDGWLEVPGRAPICVHRLLTPWHVSKIDRNQYCHERDGSGCAPCFPITTSARLLLSVAPQGMTHLCMLFRHAAGRRPSPEGASSPLPVLPL